MPQILKVDPTNPENWKSVLSTCQNVLKEGGIIAFPTDTFYGLGVDPFNKKAVGKIYKIKHRDPKKPLLLLIDSIKKLECLVEEPSDACKKLMDSFWPGPLTLLFKPTVSIENITPGLIAIRQPGNPVTLKILSGLDHPLTAPSANISGDPPPVSAEQVKDGLGNQVDLILDAGACQGGKPSTLADATENPVRIIRDGAVPYASIQESLNELGETLQTQESQ